MKDLIIFGASGFGREVAWVVERINAHTPTWNLIGFMDDNENIQGTTINGYKVIGKTCDIGKYSDAYFVVAIGASKVREKIVNNMKAVNPNIKFGTVIDPSVAMSGLAAIGEGTIICAYSIINVNTTIGSHVSINMDCVVSHDSVLQDFVTLYPSVSVSGNVNIGHAVELGTGLQVIQGKTIGDYSIVGAGAVVIDNLPAKCTAVGVPAKPIKFFD